MSKQSNQRYRKEKEKKIFESAVDNSTAASVKDSFGQDKHKNTTNHVQGQ